MKIPNSMRSLPLIIAIAGILLSAGCVTNGRRVLLREFGPSVPVVGESPLKGKVVWIKGFTAEPDLVSLEPGTKPEEPVPFKYMPFARDQESQWTREMRALQKASPKTGLQQIGNMRNGFGMVMSHVYALNNPADWFNEGLKYDLEAQGAQVIYGAAGEKAENADVAISGVIQLCRTDMYFVINGTLVVDLVVQPKAGEPRKRRIHNHGATAAILASEGEYFHSLRDARQKFSILAMQEISQALPPEPAPINPSISQN